MTRGENDTPRTSPPGAKRDKDGTLFPKEPKTPQEAIALLLAYRAIRSRRKPSLRFFPHAIALLEKSYGPDWAVRVVVELGMPMGHGLRWLSELNPMLTLHRKEPLLKVLFKRAEESSIVIPMARILLMTRLTNVSNVEKVKRLAAWCGIVLD